MADEFGLRLTEPIDIYLYDDPAALQASVPGAPGWIGGIAFPKHSIILLLAWSDCLPECSRILRHELGHLVFTRLTFNCTTSPPTWLAEGLATNVEGGGDDLYADQLASAIEGDRLLSLAQLEGSFSVHSRTAGLAYAQSYSIVRFLIEQYGRDRLVALMQEITAGEPFDQALMTIYELNRPQLEAEWRAAMGASSQIPGIEEASELPTVVPTFALPSPVVSTENPTITPRTANEPPPDTPTAERQQSSTAVANTKAQPTLEGDGTDSQSEVKGVQQQNWPVFLALSIVFVLFLAVYYLLWSRRKN
jgi:hypothetical protein